MFRASASRRSKHLTLHFVLEGKSSKKKEREEEEEVCSIRNTQVYACELGGLASDVRKGKE